MATVLASGVRVKRAEIREAFAAMRSAAAFVRGYHFSVLEFSGLAVVQPPTPGGVKDSLSAGQYLQTAAPASPWPLPSLSPHGCCHGNH